MGHAGQAHDVIDPGGVEAVLGQRRHRGLQQPATGGPTLATQVAAVDRRGLRVVGRDLARLRRSAGSHDTLQEA